MTKNYFKNKLSKTQKLFKDSLERQIEEGFPEMKRVHKPSVEEFKEKWIKEDKPVVITGLLDDWEAMKKWDLAFFKNNCHDVPIKGNLYDPRYTHDTTIGKIIERMMSGDEGAYVQEWWFEFDCPFLGKDYRVPEIFRDDLSHKLFNNFATIMFIGSKDSSSYLHQDSLHTNLWSAQIKGKKTWYFFGRKAILPEREDGSPDVDTFLKDPDSEIMHCTLLPGEVLYFPYYWWHRTKIIETSISVHGLYVTENILSKYLKDMFAITLAMSLNSDLILEKDKMRYNINELSCRVFAKLMDFDPNDVLGIVESSKRKQL